MSKVINGRLFMNIQEYADHRNVSRTSISKAISAGRIYKVERGETKGLIDVEQADSMYSPRGQTGFNGRRPRDLARAVAAKANEENTPEQSGMENDDPLKGVDADDPLEPPKRMSKATVDNINAILSDKGQHEIAVNTEEIYVKSRAANEAIKAEMAKIKLDQLKGTLIYVDDVVKAVDKISRQNRDAWLNWPDDVGAEIAAELGKDKKEVTDILKRYVRQNLEEQAEMDFGNVTQDL